MASESGERANFCVHYDACETFAERAGWPGFRCTACALAHVAGEDRGEAERVNALRAAMTTNDSADMSDLAWHFNSAAGAMGLRSGFGSMVATLEGLRDTGYHAYEISEHALEAATRDRRISKALALCSPAARSALGEYFTGSCPVHPLAARTGAAKGSWWRVPAGAPGPTAPGKPARAPKRPFAEWLARLDARLAQPHPQAQDLSLALRIRTEADEILRSALAEYRTQVRRRE